MQKSEIMYLCTQATQHTPHSRLVSSRLVSSRLVSSLFSSLLFSSLLFSSLLFSSLLFSSLLFSSLLFSSLLISISSAILLKLTFANISVGKSRPCEQDTRMSINITAQKNIITLLFVCLFVCLFVLVWFGLVFGFWFLVFGFWFLVWFGCLFAECCCLFAVGRLLVVCLLYVRCEFGSVGSHSRTRMRAVSCIFTFTKHRAGQHKKKDDVNGRVV